MKTRKVSWPVWGAVVVLLGLLLLFVCIVKSFCEGPIKLLENRALAQARPAETRAPEAILAAAGASEWYKEWVLRRDIPKSIKEEYERELKEAESCIEGGFQDVSGMEAHLTLAALVVEDANIPEEARAAILKDFAEKSKVCRINGYRNAAYNSLVMILAKAHMGYDTSIWEEMYRLSCSRAGLQPDEAKIRKAEGICTAVLTELERLEK